MKTTTLFVLLFLSIGYSLYAQNKSTGLIYDSTENKEIAYVNIRNLSNHENSLSDKHGIFSIKINNDNDSLYFSAIGFQPLLTSSHKNGDTIYLSKKKVLFRDVIIKPVDYSVYWDLTDKAILNFNQNRIKSKCYYSLKTKVDSIQTEMVEGYYNAQVNGVQLEKLSMKAGRYAMNKIEKLNRYFYSQEIASLIVSMQLFKKDYSKFSPFNTWGKKRAKSYDIYLEAAELNDAGDSIYIFLIKSLKDKNQLNAKLWINVTNEKIIQCEFTNNSHSNLFFKPINKDDEIDSLVFKLTYSFDEVRTKLNKINFDYSFNYKKNSGEKEKYSVNSYALLVLYSENKLFNLPMYREESLASFIDYNRINSFPYNDFFWKYNDELMISSDRDKNQNFFITSDINSSYDKDKLYNKYKVFKSAFVLWSENRINYKPNITSRRLYVSDNAYINISEYDENEYTRTVKDNNGKVYTILKTTYGYDEEPKGYNFDIDLFIDSNQYGDSMNILTELVYNPMTSYFYLPITSYSKVFFNLYFDLCQIEKLRADSVYKENSNTVVSLKNMYEYFQINKNKTLKVFDNQVNMGRNKKELKTWNEYVWNRLGIDNYMTFGIYELEKLNK